MRRTSFLAAGMAGALLAAPAPACTISSAGVAFGGYNPRSASPDNGSATISLACATTVTAPVVTLGTGQSGTYSPREMTSGGWTLNYNLYTNSARTIVWGDGTGGTVSLTLSGGTIIGGLRRFSRTVYGRIPALQNVGAGTYGDTVVMTVIF